MSPTATTHGSRVNYVYSSIYPALYMQMFHIYVLPSYSLPTASPWPKLYDPTTTPKPTFADHRKVHQREPNRERSISVSIFHHPATAPKVYMFDTNGWAVITCWSFSLFVQTGKSVWFLWNYRRITWPESDYIFYELWYICNRFTFYSSYFSIILKMYFLYINTTKILFQRLTKQHFAIEKHKQTTTTKLKSTKSRLPLYELHSVWINRSVVAPLVQIEQKPTMTMMIMIYTVLLPGKVGQCIHQNTSYFILNCILDLTHTTDENPLKMKRKKKTMEKINEAIE